MRFVAGACLAAGLSVLAINGAAAERFTFVALGDTAYNPPADYPKYEALIDRINATKPAFSIHVGDTWGIQDCREPQQRQVLAFFQRYKSAVVYTPGDNEWVDCVDPEAARLTLEKHGDVAAILKVRPDLAAFFTFDAQYERRFADDGIARLEDIRRVFFSKPMSLGQKPIAVTRQADVSEHHAFVENARWEKDGVEFATINVPGSANGFMINDEARAREAIARNRANVDWIRALFADATAKNAKAVVIALQASLFEAERDNDDFSGQRIRGGDEGPYYWIAFAIRDLGAKFGKPVLVINGDFHDFIVDRPFRVSKSEEKPARYDNIERLQVYGAPDLKAARVDVDTDTPWVFTFAPLY
jgi:hypothetical protein